jgi:hypothetical protein
MQPTPRMRGRKWTRIRARQLRHHPLCAECLRKGLARRIGTTTEAFSGLAYAGQFAGVSAEDLTTSFRGLNKAFIDAENPASQAAIAFKALDLSFRELKASDPSAAFVQIAQRISGFADGAEKAAVATALFGKSGSAAYSDAQSGRGRT